MERKVIRASVLGFCMGVRRAVDMAKKSLEDFDDTVVYTYGPIIHNKNALKKLEEKKLLSINSDEELEAVEKDAASALSSGGKPPVVMIRAHGIPPETKLSIEKSGCVIVDATCPRVLANQKKAATYAGEGYTVIVAGDRNHGEVAALAGCVRFAGAECILVADRNDAENVAVPCAGRATSDGKCPETGSQAAGNIVIPGDKTSGAPADCQKKEIKAVLIGQTTISRSEYDAVAAVLRRRIPGLLVLDTICPATMERQKALSDLCDQVDGVVVIGGKNSANTRRLFITAKELCSHVVHIESAEEIPQDFFQLKTVGIAAGASTPDDIIDEVEKVLKSRPL
ncbi:MAG: 4-hydroxy-3-methylbut-2-enyl diphosphate reductase [Treponemataceae bacterium]|nr:4-hydroxy-3-methylbut-2-enyl diphosphate reductase [Treponemataceae bacterium]